MTTQRIFVLALLLALAAPTAVLAGEIDPGFARKMSEAPPGQMFSAIVMMADQVNVPALDASLKKMNATRRFRHEYIVTRLRGKASTTQGAILSMLDDHASMGQAAGKATSMWLVNAILVKATPASLALVSRQPEVSVVYDGGLPIELIHPFDEGEVPENPLDAPEAGITAINAPSLWSLGYEGQGILVSNIDTGVYLDHTTLKARWRGNDPGVTLAETWHDPVTSNPVPRDLNGHGTHTMGTICGSGGIGVAPEAKWIASGTIDRVSISRTVQDALLAFQWVSDPDQDPKTILDVPHVCSNSWGLSPLSSSHNVNRCDKTFWAVIDNAEYAGVTVVFAAGNEGTRGGSSGSLRTPSDRIDSVVNVFSVGALNTLSTGIASFSSRGPSGCDKKTVKPEVCARGQSVRSASRSGTTRYTSKSGTSMACPHVAGAIALLQQVWPDATPEQLKTALLTTCDDLGSTGDDNTYGMGRINCLSAYTQLVGLRPNVSASVMGTVRTHTQGQTLWGHVVLSNNTHVEQKVKVALRFYFEGQPTSLVLVPEVDFTVPADYSNKNFPILVGMPIPTGLPVAVLDPKLWSLRATIKQGAKTFVSEYEFTIK